MCDFATEDSFKQFDLDFQGGHLQLNDQSWELHQESVDSIQVTLNNSFDNNVTLTEEDYLVKSPFQLPEDFLKDPNHQGCLIGICVNKQMKQTVLKETQAVIVNTFEKKVFMGLAIQDTEILALVQGSYLQFMSVFGVVLMSAYNLWDETIHDRLKNYREMRMKSASFVRVGQVQVQANDLTKSLGSWLGHYLLYVI